MDILKLLLLSLLLSSCAKLSYLVEQGTGQLGLEFNGRSNEDVLKDPEVSEKHKDKIRLIQKVKNYFFNYFDLEDTGIYDETTFLESKAVTYLLIMSPKNEIRPYIHSFPIVGSFPYIGFFSKESAQEFSKDYEELSHYIRPVYAYSTLDQWIFDDNILSSFFELSDERLIELVFHELIHTIFFIKNDVSFNENFADFVALKLTHLYLDKSTEEIDAQKSRSHKNSLINQALMHAKLELNMLYKSGQDPDIVLKNFLEETFKEKMLAVCEHSNITSCWPLNTKWNNAKFAAIGTYVEKQNDLDILYAKWDIDLRSFFDKVQSLYKRYLELDDKGKFLTFIKKH